MISKCANPECSAPFHYLRQGRIFQVNRDQDGHVFGGPFVVREDGHPCRLEHFWLCGSCAQRLTLVIDPQRGVIATPLPRARGERRKQAA